MEELIFGEEDRINLFDDPEDDADDVLMILDDLASDLPEMYQDDDDLVFVDAISVRDRRKIANIKISEVQNTDELERKKTRRRTNDETEIKKERSIAFARKNIVVIGISALVLVIIIALIVVGVRNFKENHSTVPKPSASEETYQVKDQEAIDSLMNTYYKALADNDTYVLNEVLNPVFDHEMTYIQIMSAYVDAYDNIVCYATEGGKEGEYIVATYYEVKYNKVKGFVPGMAYYYVVTNEDGDLSIDNLYSQHNRKYLESMPSTEIVSLMTAYQTSPDMQSMMAQVQASYDEAVASNENLKEMVEVTLPAALADWYGTMQAYLDIQMQDPDPEVEDPAITDTEDPVVGGSETEASGTIYATDAINIRQAPTTESEKLASVSYGAELTRLATTDDGWTKIKTGDLVGYVKSEYVSETKPAGGSASSGTTITVSETVKMRAGKGTEYEEVTVVLGGESVTVVEGDSNGWTKVTYGGATGYIRSDLLQ